MSFAEAVLEVVSERPMLVADLVSELRERSWRNVRAEEVESVLREFGAHLRARTHGAGIAVYVATAPFTEVETRHGVKPVRTY